MGKRIAVATCDPITAKMPGPAIRAWNFAEQLSVEHDVQLISIERCERVHPDFPVRQVDEPALREIERWMDVLVFQGGLLRIHPFLMTSPKVVVADVYDPFHLENLEESGDADLAQRSEVVTHLNGVLSDQLQRGDFFLCASERQRDFWLGSLTTLGRVNPATYDVDPTLRSLIDVVPFGLPSTPPEPRAPALRGVVDGIGRDDLVLLWGGGVYNWFDPLTLLEAVDRLRRREPRVRLYFLGLQHPNPAIPEMRVATELRQRAAAAGLVGTHVFFNEGWVDYDRRGDYLLEADIAVSTHFDHVETAFSFRTRMLDYLWAGRPIVTTTGDAFAELVVAHDLGEAVPPGDPGALEAALFALLSDAGRRRGCGERARAVSERYRWPDVTGPLLEFCRHPRRAPDTPPARPAAPEERPPRKGIRQRLRGR